MRRYLLLVGLLWAGFGFSIPSSAYVSEMPARVFVFFNADSAALDGDAQTLLKRVAQAAGTSPSKTVRVLGFAAPDTGTPAYNHVLAQARAQNVVDGLVAAGLSPNRVHLEARGAVPFEQIPTESRRVEIVVGTDQKP